MFGKDRTLRTKPCVAVLTKLRQVFVKEKPRPNRTQHKQVLCNPKLSISRPTYPSLKQNRESPDGRRATHTTPTDNLYLPLHRTWHYVADLCLALWIKRTSSSTGLLLLGMGLQFDQGRNLDDDIGASPPHLKSPVVQILPLAQLPPLPHRETVCPHECPALHPPFP